MSLIVGWGTSEMNKFIGSTICNVFTNFQQTVADRGQLCVCKNLTYEACNTPDYDDLMVQQYYILRYFPAYLVEYYLMYTQMLSLDFLPEQLNVLSIGCGCGVDLWGLKFAISQRGENPDVRITYHGVDKAKWHYQDNLGLTNAQFYTGDISNLGRSVAVPYNVLAFPKSIAELPTDVFEGFCQMLKSISFTQDHIVVACSLMTEGINHDSPRVERIATALATCGFTSLDSTTVHWETKGDRWLGEFCPRRQFNYPDDIKAVVDKMAFACPKYVQNNKSCETGCIGSLNKKPITMSSYIKYALLRFRRGE